jgi:hypothetical protein
MFRACRDGFSAGTSCATVRLCDPIRGFGGSTTNNFAMREISLQRMIILSAAVTSDEPRAELGRYFRHSRSSLTTVNLSNW